MAHSRRVSRLIAMLSTVLAVKSAAQTTTASPTTSAITAVSSTVGSASATTASTSSDVVLSLVSIAESLLSSYYPSISLDIATLTFPSIVVIDSTTYTVDSGSTISGLTISSSTTSSSTTSSSTTSSSTTTSVLAEATNTTDAGDAASLHHGLSSNAKLGIAIGCGAGGLALAVLAVVFCCLYRRKRKTGAYFVRRPTPSVADSDLEAWRSTRQPEVSLLSSGLSREWTEKYPRESTRPSSATAPEVAAQELIKAPPMTMHPAFARQHSHYSGHSSSDDNPFYTPQEERSVQYDLEGRAAAAPVHTELGADELSRGQQAPGEGVMVSPRPQTPMDPFLAMMSGANQHQQRARQMDPFISPEEEEEVEERDLVSPIIPARSRERRHSPMVHYPSWGEMSEFDFSENGGSRPLREQGSYESGGDGWRENRDSAYGRHEMP